MKLLFIGGTGNISSDAVRLLQARGHNIAIISRGTSPLPCEGPRRIIVNRHELQDMTNILAHETFDVVINFTGFTPADMAIDEACFAGKIKQYIFISSATVYAKPHTKLPITEKTPLGNPFSEYAQQKEACEKALAISKLPWTIVRPSHTYSESWIPNIISSAGYTFANRLRRGLPVVLHNDGQSLWTLTHTRDFAVGLAGLVGLERSIGEAFHITSDQALTWNQIYAEIARAFGVSSYEVKYLSLETICAVAPSRKAGLQGDKAEHGVFDNAKIKAFVPDFECQISFRQGMTLSAAYFDADRSRKVINPKVDQAFDELLNIEG